jgi:hypothetical protein
LPRGLGSALGVEQLVGPRHGEEDLRVARAHGRDGRHAPLGGFGDVERRGAAHEHHERGAVREATEPGPEQLARPIPDGPGGDDHHVLFAGDGEQERVRTEHDLARLATRRGERAREALGAVHQVRLADGRHRTLSRGGVTPARSPRGAYQGWPRATGVARSGT